MAELKYINPLAAAEGWLDVRNASGVRVSVPAWLQVKVDAYQGDRTQFTFMEGALPSKGVAVGLKGSVLTIEPTSKRPTLVDNPNDMRHEEGLVFVDLDDKARITETFEMLVGKLWMGARSGKGSRGPYAVRMQVDDLPGGLKPGNEAWSALGLPDWPHSGHYSAVFDRIWFPIYTGQDNINRLNNESRYLHGGKYSAGCLSVDPDAWDSLYGYLIQRRKGPTRVGSVHIRYKA